MKKTKTLLFLFIFLLNYSIAQVTEEMRSMNQGTHNALMISIPDADDRMVEKLWKKFMKSNGAKTKKVKKSEEWFSSSADISSINGSQSIDVYASFDQSGDDVMMTAWFNMGDDDYLSSSAHPERYSAGESFLSEFEMEVYKEGVKAEIKDEENNLKKLESALKKLKKNNARYHKEIENAKEKIAKMEANIEENIQEQEEANTKIDEQKMIVSETKKKLDHREGN